MRRWRSFLAITSSAPSSIFLRRSSRPATRIENCSMLFRLRRRHDQHRDLLPLRASRLFSVCVQRRDIVARQRAV